MLAVATAICFILRPLVPTDTHVPLIYVLAVLCVSRLTEGYFYGVLASMVAVVGVNYIFTYPYFQVDFTVTGYPLTFIVMLTVSISVSALMTQIKMQEHVRLKAEKERMRANLLRAVSHDIRTPLTSIEGAAAGIIDNKDVLTEEQKEELLLNIKEEAQWMVRMVENLLSITRMNDEGTRLTTHEELVRISAKGLRIVVMFFPIVGFQMVTSNFFQSIGMASKAIFLSVSRQVLILIPCLLILPQFYGQLGVWISMPISDLIASLIAGTMLWWQFKQFRKVSV